MESVSTIEGNQLRVRALEKTDIPLVQSWYSSSYVLKKMEDNPLGLVEVHRRLRRLSKADMVKDEEFALIVEFQGEPVAFFHLMWVNWVSRTIEIDLMLNPHKGRPFVIGSVLRCVGRTVFCDLNLHKVYAFVYRSNEVSMRVFSRILDQEAVLCQYRKTPTGWEDVVIFALSAEDYRARYASRDKERDHE